MIRMYRYSEGENSYILIDGRDVEIPRFRKSGTVHSLCLFHNVNGIGILDKSDEADFSLEFYGSDGMAHAMPAGAIAGASDTVTGAAVCAVAFADLVGVKAFHSKDYTFFCSGTVYSAEITSHLGECKEITLSEYDYHGSAICQGALE